MDALEEMPVPRARKKPPQPKPTHYKVLCFSMYTDDEAALREKVKTLKARGYKTMTMSKLIRIALGQLDIEKLPIPRST